MKIISMIALLLLGISSVNSCLDDCGNINSLDSNLLFLAECEITDEDIASGRLDQCFDDVGRENIEVLVLNENKFTYLPEGVFDGMSSLYWLLLGSNDLSSLPGGLFNGLDALEILSIINCQLETIPGDLFQGLPVIQEILLGSNKISELPSGIFDGLSSLEYLFLNNNDLNDLSPGIFNELNALKRLGVEGNQLSCLPFSYADTIFVDDDVPDCEAVYSSTESETDDVGDTIEGEEESSDSGFEGFTSGVSIEYNVSGWICIVGIVTTLVMMLLKEI